MSADTPKYRRLPSKIPRAQGDEATWHPFTCGQEPASLQPRARLWALFAWSRLTQKHTNFHEDNGFCFSSCAFVCLRVFSWITFSIEFHPPERDQDRNVKRLQDYAKPEWELPQEFNRARKPDGQMNRNAGDHVKNYHFAYSLYFLLNQCSLPVVQLTKRRYQREAHDKGGQHRPGAGCIGAQHQLQHG